MPRRVRSSTAVSAALVLVGSVLVTPTAVEAQDIPLAVSFRYGLPEGAAALGDNTRGQAAVGVTGLFYFHPRVAVFLGWDRWAVECDVTMCFNSVGTMDQVGGGLRFNYPVLGTYPWIEAGVQYGSYEQRGAMDNLFDSVIETGNGRQGFRTAIGVDFFFGPVSFGPFAAYQSVGLMEVTRSHSLAGAGRVMDRDVRPGAELELSAFIFGLQMGFQPKVRREVR